jgi:hypothetical protein
LLCDSGYQGIQNLVENSLIPIKSSKLHPLTEQDKAYNHWLSKQRIAIEHVFRTSMHSYAILT